MKDIKEPLLILIALFILIGLAYSPLKNSIAKQNKANTNSSIGTGSNLGYSGNKSAAEGIKSAETDIKKLQENVNNAAGQSGRSPYYGKIRMSNIAGLRGNDPEREYLTLSTSLKNNETLKITGWYLKSEVTGYYVFIGTAALLPFPFTQTESDIVLQKGDKAYVTKGFSPIGISFRTNKCTGYFEENRTFVPGLMFQCPLPKDEKLPKFSNVYDRNDECLKIIENIQQCTTIDSRFIRDLPDTVAQSCKDYLTGQINYNTCVALHFSDTDFPKQEYRIYLNKFGPLWRPLHDTINLRDENGLVVASITY
jgi:hypothetical protein